MNNRVSRSRSRSRDRNVIKLSEVSPRTARSFETMGSIMRWQDAVAERDSRNRDVPLVFDPVLIGMTVPETTFHDFTLTKPNARLSHAKHIESQEKLDNERANYHNDMLCTMSFDGLATKIERFINTNNLQGAIDQLGRCIEARKKALEPKKKEQCWIYRA